jgi:tetratricopeptide (TPR) repeat protein
MKRPRTNTGIWIAIGVMAAGLSLPAIARAQGGGNSSASSTNSLTQMDGNQTQKQIEENGLDNPKIAQAYKKFHEEKDLDKKIKQGNEFVNRYPSNFRANAVYEELAEAYFAKRDLTGFYACVDQGLTHFPNDPSLLSVTGATMARAYDHSDPDADKKLEKAEGYEEQAIELLKNQTPPPTETEQQFAAYKKQILTTAHSGLGLIYFRQGKFDDSVTELQEATKDASTPDPTDYLILGGDYQNLNRFKEAADAFNQCAQVAGPMQSGCKTYAEQSLKQAGQAK